jgi:hypothetical protein
MADLFPKLTDVGSLKAASALLALPMLCVAYTFQTGAEISFDGTVYFDVTEDLSQNQQIARLLLIFFLKSIWISFLGMIGYSILGYLHFEFDFPFLLLSAVLLLAFGIFGIFGGEVFPLLKVISPFWFYCSIIWALFFHSMCDQLKK